MRSILILTLILLFSCQNNSENMDKMQITFDWQGHRGARGMVPENSIPSFLKALEYPVKTLELDVVVSKDNKVIISHEPWFSHHICSKPDTSQVNADEEKDLLIMDMTYAEIKAFDCGSRGNDKFPEQQKMKVYKPSLKEMISSVEFYCSNNDRPKPYYNIEIKSNPEFYDTLVPSPENFVKLVLKEIKETGIYGRCNLQSFDINVLNEIHRQNPEIPVAYLIESMKSFEENLALLNFQPEIYSPYHMFVNKELVEKVHAKNMKLIPWTVNEVDRMRELLKLGVDGIITDYPNRIAEANAKKEG